jgi:hypothetical protein
MENLIKTKKLETRFFLTTAAQQAGANNNQPGVIKAGTFSKSKNGVVAVGGMQNAKEFMNTTAPLNFHNITMMSS